MQRKTYNYNNSQLFALVALRVLIGWYFLYEGLVKFLNPNWTSLGYLKDSQGFLSPVFNFITEHEFLMSLADNLNIYGLTIIGLLLIVGLFTKAAGFGAISLLSLYYLSHPPLLNVVYMLPTEGSYLWIDKNIIMLCAVVVLILFPTSTQIGLDRIIFKKESSK
ncbi:MAG: DoxX family protein [Bacteroidia bacterium]|nr:DoxX family protein [Paludibacter sp.]NCB69413.1 DoxX family protein [Bacteroidia bacterium]